VPTASDCATTALDASSRSNVVIARAPRGRAGSVDGGFDRRDMLERLESTPARASAPAA
jgi:hypothetical protein